jgi:hypothetical protein
LYPFIEIKLKFAKNNDKSSNRYKICKKIIKIKTPYKKDNLKIKAPIVKD